jgi:alkaline phosphatase
VSSQTDSPRNIIVFVADGMGISTVTAARIFDGQKQGIDGESHNLVFEDFGNVAFVKTYNADSQVPDSAGTATALFSGFKANIGTLNVEPQETLRAMATASCQNQADGTPATLLERARSVDKSVGIISTARLTHATPAAVYGRSVDRGLESDDRMPEELTAMGCKSLAAQLIETAPELALGGGASAIVEANTANWPGPVVRNKAEMQAAGEGPVLGLFTGSHMSYEADRPETEPSLAEMTRFAINRLEADEDGYVLMVEAGRVDHAHHATNAYRAMTDMQAFNEAIRTATEQAGDDTLIVVTADHSHVFVIQGYPVRGNPIMGLVRQGDIVRETMTREISVALDEDGLPFTTLGYYNGPNTRADAVAAGDVLTEEVATARDFQQQTAIRKRSETHAGEDVPLYATGPGANAFGGVMDQDEVGQAIIEALEGE